MQHQVRQASQTFQTFSPIQVPQHRSDTQLPPGGDLSGMTQQRQYPEMSSKPGSGTAGHIPAAND